MSGPPTLRLASTFRFGLPPSLGREQLQARAERLEQFLEHILGQPTRVTVGESYDRLAKDVLAGRLDAAWAPPFVCARLEAMGVRVLVRGIRQGAASYRAALVCRAADSVTVESLQGKSAVWVDPNSVGGYLLATAHLRSRKIEPSRTFFQQSFAGSYRAALEALLAGRADVSSVYAPSRDTPGGPLTGADEILPGADAQLKVVAFSEPSPNDGVAVSMSANPELVQQLEGSLLALAEGDQALLLRELFNLDKFERAPRMSYRALYRVALASI